MWRRTHGSSPLTRGKRISYAVTRPHSGLIPAHAGKTLTFPGRAPQLWAHPRSRGENLQDIFDLLVAAGSSPLTRGKPMADKITPTLTRLIPAHAGKTCSRQTRARSSRAHPRSRGENFTCAIADESGLGSSPLTRGKLGIACPMILAARLIPAHAGKTCRQAAGRAPARAHPRSRGENQAMIKSGPLGDGSSPLTRGKPQPRAPGLVQRRLIPAHAGKTLPDLRFYCADRSDLGNP